MILKLNFIIVIKMKLNKVPPEIIFKIIYYLNDDIDIKNLLFCDKHFYELYNYFHLYKYFKYNLKNNKYTKEYHEIKIIDKKNILILKVICFLIL